MSSYTIIKKNKKSGKITFLMANAVGTKTFKNDISNAWSDNDHRVACAMLMRCVDKHNDTDKFAYSIDDVDESPEW